MKKIILVTGLIFFTLFYLYQRSNESNVVVEEAIESNMFETDESLEKSTTSVKSSQTEEAIPNQFEDLPLQADTDLELETQNALNSGYISQDEVQEFKMNRVQHLKASAELEAEAASEHFDDSQI